MDIREWMENIEESSSKDIPVIICGNKTDLRPDCIAKGMPVISKRQGERLAKSFNAMFIETSAKSGTNVQDACLEMARYLSSLEDNEIKNQTLKLDEENKSEKKKPCCAK